MTLPQKFGVLLFLVAFAVCLWMCASTTALLAAAALGVRP